MITNKEQLQVTRKLVVSYQNLKIQLTSNYVEQRDFFLFLLFWFLHEKDKSIATGIVLKADNITSFITSLGEIKSYVKKTAALSQVVAALEPKLIDFDEENFSIFVQEANKAIMTSLDSSIILSFDAEQSMLLYQKALFPLEAFNPFEPAATFDEDYQEIPPDFIALINRIEYTNNRQIKSAYFPFEITGEQCVYFAKQYPESHLRIECLKISPHIMRILSLAGAQDVELSFSNAIGEHEQVQKEQFDWTCTLLQPQNVNIKEDHDDELKYRKLHGFYLSERIVADSVPARYKEHGYLQHALWSLKQDGIAYMITGKGVLFRDGEKQAREILVNKNAIDAIIQLPHNMMSYCPLPLVLIILKKKRTINSILYIDATEGFAADTSRNRLTGIDKITKIFASRDEIAGVSANVSVKDIVSNDYSLNPQNYLSQYTSFSDENSDLEAERADILGQIKVIDDEINSLFKQFAKN